MKIVVLSADGDRIAYSVPDVVADNLKEYCMAFDEWLWTSPHARKYIINGCACYDESDFIEYLNQWIFPEQPSKLIENLGLIGFDRELPERFRDCPQFNF